MFTGFGPYTGEVYTDLPADARGAFALARPVLADGGPPRAAALLLEVTARDGAASLLAPTALVGSNRIGAGVSVGGSFLFDGAGRLVMGGDTVPVWVPDAGWPARGAVLLDVLADALPASLVQVDDTTDANRLVALITAGGEADLRVVSGGVTLATLVTGAVAAMGVPLRVLVGWSPTGVVLAASGGALLRATVPRPAGLIRAVLGHRNAAASLPLAGTLLADFFDFLPTDAEARRIVAF